MSQNVREVSNTLSRWHKVVGRVKSAADALVAQISDDISETTFGGNQAELFRLEKPRLKAQTDAALSRVPLLFKLNDTLETLRVALARANVEKGVSDKLARQVKLQNERMLYDQLIRAGGSSRISMDEGASLLKAESPSAHSHYGPSYAFTRVPEACRESWVAKVQELDKALQRLADELSDANASRLKLELDEEVLAHLGM